MAQLKFGGPGVRTREIDLTGRAPRAPIGVPAGVIGTSLMGPASPMARGCRITWVPPRRSRPRRGAWSVPGQKAQANRPTRMMAMTMSARTGR